MFRIATLVLLGTLASAPALAAKDPCKGVSVKKDSFGTTRALDAGALKLRKTGDKWSMQIEFDAGGGYGGFVGMNAQALPPGTKVEVMLEDGSIVALESASSAAAISATIMGVTSIKYQVPFAPTDDQLKALTAQPLKAARVVNDAEKPLANEFSNGDIKKFQEVATCMLST
ncbi:MAG: hypothetical protein H6732_09920 [Alphaproteobacteria bacterium]|nr:hypothetical protein [Alphaproteobacteria bacterium]